MLLGIEVMVVALKSATDKAGLPSLFLPCSVVTLPYSLWR